LATAVQPLETLSRFSTSNSSNNCKKQSWQYRVYQELDKLPGRHGIQALMIENVLPQLEAETNQLLARLSANQLHVQFTKKQGVVVGQRKSCEND